MRNDLISSKTDLLISVDLDKIEMGKAYENDKVSGKQGAVI